MIDLPLVDPWHALRLALVLLVGLEVAFFILRRLLPRLSLSLAHHAAAFAGASLLFLEASRLDDAVPVVRSVLVSAVILLGGFVTLKLFDAAVLQRPWSRARGPAMPQLARGLLQLAVLVLLAFACATWILELKITALVASSTVVTAVIGFALQDLLRDALAGVALQGEKPFAIGDWLLVDGVPAQVVEMSWRSTHLRTTDGVHLYEPNATLASVRIHNYGKAPTPVAWNWRVGLPYGTPPPVAKETLLAAARQSPGIVEEPVPEAFLEAWGDSAVTYKLRAWTVDRPGLQRTIDAVNVRIWHHVQRAGISFPFPTRTVHLTDTAADAEARARADLERVTALIAGVDVFQPLPAAARADLAARARHERYDVGETLVRQGEEADSLYLIESGLVAVRREAAAGATPVELARLGPGAFFGEASLLTGEPRSASVVALQGCSVLVLGREHLAPLLEADPRLAVELSRILSRRAQDTAAALEDRRRSGDTGGVRVEASMLGRIRAFFRLREG